MEEGKEARRLLVVSNHNPETWTIEQRAGWDKIDYIPFPKVKPELSFDEVVELAFKLYTKIKKWRKKNKDGKVCLQGEDTICYLIFRNIFEPIFVFPTTKKVVEKKDGKRIYSFRFVRWR